MEEVLSRLGNPHLKLPKVIHIAGTNGKGSTAATIAKILSTHSQKVGLYTSPHIHQCNERIIINQEQIDDTSLYQVLEETRIAAENTPLTFMEGFTIGALLAFSRSNLDFLVMECGMGGRIDATNIVKDKALTIITPISFDHQEYLGDNIERIAVEKAIIIRPNTPLICSAQSQEAKNIIKTLAGDQKILAYYYDEDFTISKNKKRSFNFHFYNVDLLDLPLPSLIGHHQYINFATALAASVVLNEQYALDLDQNKIETAIQNVKWPGRLERFFYKDFNQESELWLDGAHNISGAFALASWIRDQKDFPEKFIIVGFSRDKCKKEFLAQFDGVGEIIAVRVGGEPFPEKVENILKVANSAQIKITPKENLYQALRYISNSKSKSLVTICGSLHLARDLKSLCDPFTVSCAKSHL